jgi:tetratricopeptide (TPR) repeat protein
MDPQLALAHHALASLEWNYARNFPLSRAEDKRAAELDPSSANLVQVAGIDALSRGQPNEAVDFFRQHVHSDPLDALSWNLVGWALLEANRLTEAEAAFRTLLELNPNYAGARCDLAEILIAERRLDAALTAARAETDEAMRCACLSDALWALGQRTEAQASLVEAQTKYASTQAYEIAQSYALRAEKDQAFKWLGRAYENGEAQITLMRSDRALQSLRQDPRFTELLDKMHLL